MGLFRKNELAKYNTTNWDSPNLQPINGVSLQTYVAVTRDGGGGPAMAARAEQAGISKSDWTQAKIGWEVRMTTCTEVKAALTKVYAPDTDFRRHRTGMVL